MRESDTAPNATSIGARVTRLRDEDSGYVAIFVALCLPLLVGMCALAVDVATWHVEGVKAQKAADAASLGGAVYLPEDQAAAFATAQNLAASNGYSAGNGDVVTYARTNRPGQLRVTITTTVDNSFGLIFGRDQTQVTRTSVADYAGPVPMGSPCNVFGNEPTPAGSGDARQGSSVCSTNELWLNVAGPTSNKVSGDRHQANLCSGSTFGCDGGGRNAEYATAGYFYLVKAKQAGRIAIEAFDPAFVRVGDHCDENLAGASGIPVARAPVPNPAQRYVAGDGQYCTGDVLFTGDASTAQPPTTSFIVRGPYDGFDPEASPALTSCTRQFKGFGTEGQALPLNTLLNTVTGTSADARLLQANFRRWVSLCTFTAPGPGDYLIQILTNVPLGSDPVNAGNRNPNLAGSGHNRMALRAYYESGASNTQLSIGGLQRMSVYANANNLNTAFYLARIKSVGENHTLTVNLYDIGDAQVAGSLQVLPPIDATVNGTPLTTFSGCVLTKGSSATQTALSQCREPVAVSEYNGTIAKVTVPIPDGYRCNDTDPAGCWVRILYNFPGGIQDTTTWTASLDGDPVRIVE